MFPKKSSQSDRNVQTKKQQPRLPDLLLCDDCKMLGYCKESISARMHESNEMATSVQVNRPFDVKYYTAKIPFRVSSNEAFSQYAKSHLQTAYDAFHQDDFETALLHFKSVERGGNYFQSDYFLALTNFMLENYEMAGIHMQACIDHTYYRTEDFSLFLDECTRRSGIVSSGVERNIIANKPVCISV